MTPEARLRYLEQLEQRIGAALAHLADTDPRVLHARAWDEGYQQGLDTDDPEDAYPVNPYRAVGGATGLSDVDILRARAGEVLP